MASSLIEIECPECGNDSLLKRDPLYEGFRRTGEKLSCASCGHVFEDETAVPFKKPEAPRVFDAADKPPPVRVFSDDERPEAVNLFDADENKRLCRYCAHYVVNPFVQRCARLRKEVEATDTCREFTPKKQDSPGNGPGPG